MSDLRDEWLFKSETYDNCNFNVNCGCQFTFGSNERPLLHYWALQRMAALKKGLSQKTENKAR